MQSPGGLLAIDEVAAIEEDDVTDEDAVRAGSPDRTAVLAALRPEGTLYRFRFHRIGDDPRVALRERADFTADELEPLRAKIARLEWALATLRLIADRPAVVSTELAEAFGVDRPVFKHRVRRLKELGLTESLEVGYRLSPRGAALLATLENQPTAKVVK